MLDTFHVDIALRTAPDGTCIVHLLEYDKDRPLLGREIQTKQQRAALLQFTKTIGLTLRYEGQVQVNNHTYEHYVIH